MPEGVTVAGATRSGREEFVAAWASALSETAFVAAERAVLHDRLNETATPTREPTCVPTPAPVYHTPGEKYPAEAYTRETPRS